jgi:hypothetical protein
MGLSRQHPLNDDLIDHGGPIVSCRSQSKAQGILSQCCNRTATPFPTFPNEIYGMFIELLREDPYSFRACSLVSPVFRRFCTPILYRNLSLNYPVFVDNFIRVGERSNVLQHTKSFRFTSRFWTQPNEDKSHKVLDIISRKASLETLHICRAQFDPTPPEPSVLHRLSSVTVLILEQCHFGGFGAFAHFIGCFALCESLQLYGSTHRWVTEWREQEEIVGAFGLGHMNLKSFAYAVDDSSSMDMLKEIAASGPPEEIDVSFPEYRNYHNPGERKSSAAIIRSDLVESVHIY